MLVRKRWFIAAYWIVAVVLMGFATVLGVHWGDDQAPTFDNEDKGAVPATGLSRLLYSVVGGAIGATATIAVFAGVWLFLWIRARRLDENEPVEESTMSVEEMESLMAGDEDGAGPDQ